MFTTLARKVFGNPNERMLKPFYKRVERINALEPQIQALSDAELKAKTDAFRRRLAAGETHEDILDEAFATVREAARRTLGERHYDVQLIGGMVLHSGRIAEMKTGEGKTLVATLAVYLNAIEGKGVHVVTVNDYLARRDSEWMGQIYRFLGLSVGVVVPGLDQEQRRAAYAADVTYGTNNEFGFDYLRDNMKFRLEDMVQREFNFAIVDEVDSILIDEARTPLIISGSAQDSSQSYIAVDSIVPTLTEDHYDRDEKHRTVNLTDDGVERVEELLRERGIIKEGGLYDIGNIHWLHHVNQALRAHVAYTRDVDYIVQDGKIVIIDEFTGRKMEGRRYGEGLHQAIEAKEKVAIQRENQTLASITYQNYFRLYPKLAGMTGTAATEASEFIEIYGLEVAEIPTNKPVTRIDNDDVVYRSAQEKYDALCGLIENCRQRGQPVLVGTVSIEKSEMIAKQLKKRKIPHAVLNARFHEQEAEIIAEAGVPGAVTIATNMAGRGTDIKLGGNLDLRIVRETASIKDEEKREAAAAKIKTDVEKLKKQALEAGGLYVIGTERHESRRIDNQLRGRSGRQGDPGESTFFISLEDDLMRIFGSDKMGPLLQKMGLKEGDAIIHPWINKGVERAQKKVEEYHFEIRKNLLKFDNVMNDQRKEIYQQRKEIMSAERVDDIVLDMREDVIEDLVARAIPPGSYNEKWDLDLLVTDVRRILNLDLPIAKWAEEEGIAEQEITERIKLAVDDKMKDKEKRYGADIMRSVEKSLLLQVLDMSWKEHLLALDYLRQGINLRAYAQRDPLNEYKAEAFDMFVGFLAKMREVVTAHLTHVEIQVTDPAALSAVPEQPDPQELKEIHDDPSGAAARRVAEAARMGGAAGVAGGPVSQAAQGFTPQAPQISRNAPCPCGSGKKYKHCHGQSQKSWAG